MSPKILKECVSMADPKMFTAGPCQSVASWCWEYFSQTGDAPQQVIEDLFRARAMDLGETDAEGVKAFLQSISDTYTPPNETLLVKEASSFFKLRALQKLKDDIDRALLLRDASMGEHVVAEYVAPEATHRESVSLFGCDSREIAAAFNEESEELFSFPGEAAEKVLGKFNRADFVAFAAPPKRGKSFWLMKTGTTAARNGLNVLLVSCEMPKTQVLRRLWQQVTGTSRRGEDAVNARFEVLPNGRFGVTSPTVPTPQVDSNPETIAGLQERFRTYWRGHLEIECWPTGVLTVPMLKRRLKDLAVYQRFVPDVVVIDYADIMRAVNTRQDRRDQLDEIWSALRGLAQEMGILIVTASQTGRATVNGARDADDADLAEDIRKLAHVTKLLVINQTLEERKQGIYRISNNTTRDEAAATTQLVCTAMLAIGEPMLDCRLLSDCDLSTTGGDEEFSAEEEPRRRRQGNRKFKIG